MPFDSACQAGWLTVLPARPLQGAGVTNTIRSNIANLNYYKDKPDLYM